MSDNKARLLSRYLRMDHKEIYSAAQEVCAILQRDPNAIDFADLNKQFQRFENAGLPINRDPTLRVMREPGV